MKKNLFNSMRFRAQLLLFIAILCATLQTTANEVLDTVYYDVNWKGCSKTFSTYYRVMTVPNANASQKQFRDFYMTGQVRREGNYVSIDKNDDSNSIFDGDVATYYKSGELMSYQQWEDSHLVGDEVFFYENGKVKSHSIYNRDGLLDGDVSFFDESGNLVEMKSYSNGISNTYYTLYNQYGTQGHYDAISNKLIMKPVSISDMNAKVIRQKKYYYYDDCNGIYLGVNVESIKKYGKYYAINLTLFNNTNTSFVFYPEQITAHGWYADGKKKEKAKNNGDDMSENTRTRIKKIIEKQQYNNWMQNDFGSLGASTKIHADNQNCYIADNLLIEKNMAMNDKITVDTMKIQQDAYRYRIRIANANKETLNGENTMVSNEASHYGLVFNHDENGNYCAVVLRPLKNEIKKKFQALQVSLIQCDNGIIDVIDSKAMSSGISLEENGMNTISVDVDNANGNVFVSVGKDNRLDQILEAKTKHPNGAVQVGYLIGANDRVALEWAILTEISIEYQKQKKQSQNAQSKDGKSLKYSYMNSELFGDQPQSMFTDGIKVWDYNDYIKKVEKRQMWDKVLMAVATSINTYDAGTSTTNTTITTRSSAYGRSNGNASAYGYTNGMSSGNGNTSVYSSYGYANGMFNSNTTAGGSSTTHISTKSYDALAAAIAQEKAANDFAIYSSSLDADTEAINENYLMTTTLDPQTSITGFILLDKNKPEIIDLTIPVNGAEYRFRLTDLPK